MSERRNEAAITSPRQRLDTAASAIAPDQRTSDQGKAAVGDSGAAAQLSLNSLLYHVLFGGGRSTRFS